MITNKVNAIVLKSGGTNCYVPFEAELQWDPIDPLAVQLILHVPDGDVVWTIGRELLHKGSTSLTKFGDGDVRFRKEAVVSSRLLVCLNSPEGHADIALNQPHVVRFLNRIEAECALGQEDLTESIDGLIEEIYRA